MEVPTREELKKKKVVELRAELSKLHLPQAGVKDDLVTRLIAHYQQLADEKAANDKAAPVESGGQTDDVQVEPPATAEEAMETNTDEKTSTDLVDTTSTEVMEVVENEQTKEQEESHDEVIQSHDQPALTQESTQEPAPVKEDVQEQIPPEEKQPSPIPPAPVDNQPVPSAPPTVVSDRTDPSSGSQTTSDYYSAAESPKEQQSEQSQTEHATESTAGEEKGKKKKKKKRRRRRHDQAPPTTTADVGTKENEVEIEYVQEDILQPDDPNYQQFHKIFEAFKLAEIPEKTPKGDSVSELVAKAAEASKRLAQARHVPEEEEEDEEEEKEPVTMTKKKLRKLNRLTVAQLKQLVDRPDVVEMHDVTALDPKLLIHLKSTRNTVPVPRHWCFKRKYLQGKRGIEKPPFNLPDFIKATGVMEMRQALEEKEDAKTLKQKTRERVRPKMGKLTIDYQKLHDAFFKWQTKPKMSLHGELYYEGKEFETRLRQKKPGDLSDELRRSLGMPIGMGKHKFPPPWLVAMQRYGPPPSYPHLKIPGLNAPIPEGCSFGYFVGGWGKPPVDEAGRPLYGDVFGSDAQEGGGVTNDDEGLDRTLWGELESEEEESEEESEEEEEGSPKPEDIQAGLVTPMEGLVTPSGLTSIPAGLETPEMIQLRKKKIEEAMEQGGETPSLYTVLPEKTAAVGGAMMGSSHVYDVGSAVPGATKKVAGSGMEGIEVALDPSELDLDTATMTARYEEQMKEKNVLQKEDLSDMVAEHAAKQKKRKRTAADSGGKASKKLKEFKF